MVCLVQVRDVRAAVAPIQDAALLPRQVPAPVPEHVRVVRLVAAEEAEGAVETAADRGVVLEERAEMPLQEDNVNEM